MDQVFHEYINTLYNIYCSEWSLKNMLLFLLFRKTINIFVTFFLRGCDIRKDRVKIRGKFSSSVRRAWEINLVSFFDFDIIWNCSSKKKSKKKEKKKTEIQGTSVIVSPAFVGITQTVDPCNYLSFNYLSL